jgi:hypothetical protein
VIIPLPFPLLILNNAVFISKILIMLLNSQLLLFIFFPRCPNVSSYFNSFQRFQHLSPFITLFLQVQNHLHRHILLFIVLVAILNLLIEIYYKSLCTISMPSLLLQAWVDTLFFIQQSSHIVTASNICCLSTRIIFLPFSYE